MRGKRLAKPERKGVGRALKIWYRILVALSIVIISVFVFWKVVIRPPSIDEGPEIEITLPPDHTADPDASPVVTTTQRQRREGVYNILLVGSDDGNGNTDTIIICSYDTKAKTIGMLSIPRDTLIDCDRSVKKINAAYAAGGIEQLEQEIEALLGIPIDHYCHINLQGVSALVDAIDGVDFYVPRNMDYNDGAGLRIQYNEGWLHVRGSDAIKILRYRNNNVGNTYGYNDTGRTETQQAFLLAVMKKVVSWNSVSKITQLIDVFNKYVDTSLKTTELISLASSALGMDLSEAFHSATLPGDGSVTYKGTPWYYVAYSDETLALVNELVNPYVDDLTEKNLGIFDPTGVNKNRET